MKRKRCPACKIKRLALDAPKRAICSVCVKLGIQPRVRGGNVENWKRTTTRRLLQSQFDKEVAAGKRIIIFAPGFAHELEFTHTARRYD